jgi:hypothetical protein
MVMLLIFKAETTLRQEPVQAPTDFGPKHPLNQVRQAFMRGKKIADKVVIHRSKNRFLGVVGVAGRNSENILQNEL